MKTKIITLFVVFTLSNDLVATELEWVDEQIEAIKPPRKGVQIMTSTDTFIFLSKNIKEKKDAKSSAVSSAQCATVLKSKLPLTLTIKESVKKKDYQLIAILNKSAKIDDKWYKKGEKIDNFIIVDIDKNLVTLKDVNKEIILSTSSQKQTLKFKNK